MRTFLVLAALLSAAAVRADQLLTPEQTQQLLDLEKAKDALKNDPCLAENQRLNYFELLAEYFPAYYPETRASHRPPESTILKMESCEVKAPARDGSTTRAAERRYTSGDWGLVLTTAWKSERTSVTVIFKHNGSWIEAGRMGEFPTQGLFIPDDRGNAVVEITHPRDGGLALPYVMHLVFHQSWRGVL